MHYSVDFSVVMSLRTHRIMLVVIAAGFPEMKRALNATGRHIVYSCEWPMYERAHGGTVSQCAAAALLPRLRRNGHTLFYVLVLVTMRF